MVLPRMSVLVAMAITMLTSVAAIAQSLEPNPAAMQAFTELVKAYRAWPSLGVKTTVEIEVMEGDVKANGSEVEAEFLFGPDRTAVVKLRGYTCYVANGEVTMVHESNEHAYFSTPDDGSPYYTLLTAFIDLPYPELALMLGEDAIEDVLMQFHPKAPWITPTDVKTEQVDGKAVQRLKLASEIESLEMTVDPKTKLIQHIELHITGGSFVQPGTTLVYRYKYEYEPHDKPLDPALLRFDPGDRQRVDVLAALTPRPVEEDIQDAEVGDAAPGRGELVGKPAPGFTLTTADGKAIDLDDLRGRVVVLDFWASWCGPCMQAMPKLHEVAKWASGQQLPVTVLTINVWEVPTADAGPDERLASAKATWTKRGFTLPILMDYSDQTAEEYGVRGIPATIVIRADGIVHAQHTGVSSDYAEVLKAEIEAALKAVEPGA